MLRPKWSVKFRVQSVRPTRQVSVGGFEFRPITVDPGTGDNICYTEIELSLETEEFNQRFSSAPEYEYAEQTLARQHVRQIKAILDSSIILDGFPLQVSVEAPELMNKEELKSADLTLQRTLGKSLTAQFCVAPRSDRFDEYLEFSERLILQRESLEQDEIYRICRWLERGICESDSYDKFIYYWIGFNAIYEKLGEGKNDDQKLLSTISQLYDEQAAQEVVESIPSNNLRQLTTFNVTSETGKTNWSQDLFDRLAERQKSYIEIVKLALRCIYGVRKRLFHGYLSIHERDESVSACNPVLEKMFRKTLELHLRH